MASGVADPAPDPCTGEVETHAAAGACEALCSRARGAPTVSGRTKRSDKYARGDHRPVPVRHQAGSARLLDVALGGPRRSLRPGSPSATRTGANGARW